MNKVRIFALWFFSLVFLSGCGQGRLYKDKQVIAGITVEVISADKRAGQIVFAEIKRIEKLLSLNEPESEISRLNKQGWLKASSETLYVLKKAAIFWREIGFDKLQISDNIIKFSALGAKLDLSGIANGYAVDSAVSKLKDSGIRSALIKAGRGIYCLGDKWGKPWKVDIQAPSGKAVIGSFYLKDKAASISSRLSRSGVSSVAVLAVDCASADALAAAIYILGKENGAKLARKFNAQAIIN